MVVFSTCQFGAALLKELLSIIIHALQQVWARFMLEISVTEHDLK